MENSETFGSGAGAGAETVGVVLCVPPAETGFGPSTGFLFFCGFRETDNGLNINGFPTNFTSSAGFCKGSGSSEAFGGGRLIPPPVLLVPPTSSL
jgi:hypothetical protein